MRKLRKSPHLPKEGTILETTSDDLSFSPQADPQHRDSLQHSTNKTEHTASPGNGAESDFQLLRY